MIYEATIGQLPYYIINMGSVMVIIVQMNATHM